MVPAPFEHIALAVTAFLIAVATILFLRPHAEDLGLVDHPDERKQHGEPVPVVGGIGIVFAVCLTWPLFRIEMHGFATFLAASLPLMITGLLDDRLNLSVRQRVLVQAVAAAVMVFGGRVVLLDLGDLWGGGAVRLGWFAVPFTMFCVIGVINAFNLVDGVDGLSGGLGLVSAAFLGLAALLLGAEDEMRLIVILAGALLGHLLFNLHHPWRPYRVFMGDAGSMFVGFALVWLAIALTQRSGGLAPISAVWILGLPVMDTIATVLRRVARGVGAFTPDRTHLHHLLLAFGCPAGRVVAIECGIAALLATIGLVAWRANIAEFDMTLGFVAVSFAYLALVSRAWRSVVVKD